MGASIIIQEQVESYIAGQHGPKSDEMRMLHGFILQIMPGCRLWFLDGTDESGKIVSNPNIGYGSRLITYADGKSREFYQVGLSANKSGISVYVLGIEDKTYLARACESLGKAKVTGYCIKFRALKDIDLDVLEAAIRDGIAAAH